MNKFHQSFKVNGTSFSSEDELLKFSKNEALSITNFLIEWFSLEDFIEVKTSGSTGTPKLIQLKKEFMINSAKATGEFFNLSEKTKALLCLSPDYIAGKMMLVRAMVLGWEIDIVQSTSNVKIIKKYDFSAMVPLQLRNSLTTIHNIKKLIVGGGVVASDLLQEIQGISTEVFATYGMTETITHIAVKKLNQNPWKYYETLPNIEISTDNRNCLKILAPKVSEEVIITNDVVEVISNNQFEWIGRFDNVINSGGIKLHPEKIEEKLSKVISERFFVIGISDITLGEKLILLIEGNPQKIDLESCGLSKYEIPKNVFFIENFIETDTKKIQRKKTLDLIKF